MARSLDDVDLDELASTVQARGSRIDRAAARAFAAAVSALLISIFVVSQSSVALDPDGTVAGNNVAAGTVSLTDDDLGRSLFDLDAMAPGRPVSECISVVYDGTILPVALTLDVQTTGDLGPYLGVVVERGTGGSFEDCGDFVPSEQVFSGSLDDLDREGVVPLGFIYNSGTEFSFRVRFELADEADAVGRSATIDFVWEATP